jgi:predicted O-methyltransferase YrrM
MDVRYPLPLGGKWALGWDGATILAREVGSTGPEVVVELGSGASSLVIGLQLRASGHGHLYTLDHEPEYAALTRRHVTALGLDRWVTVLDAPLVEHALEGERFRWYALPDAVRSVAHIDLLVVDGPPQKTDPGGTPRFPAMPVLAGSLGPGSVIFVDDARREAEQRMLERWLRDEPRWVREDHPTRHGRRSSGIVTAESGRDRIQGPRAGRGSRQGSPTPPACALVASSQRVIIAAIRSPACPSHSGGRASGAARPSLRMAATS